MLYARAITLRNCGRFTVVASDFGSNYHTHSHVTGEALYASLTRGTTWRPHVIDPKNDPETFTLSYNIEALPLWFLPGLFVVEGNHLLSDLHFDTTVFNVVHEFYPSTNRSYVFERGNLVEKGRPSHVPAYGTIQSITPDHHLVTYAFSAEWNLLDRFAQEQTFVMGKKRTMFQIVDLSPIVEGMSKQGICETGWLELPPTYGGRFQSFEVAAGTMRYLIIRGTTREERRYVEFAFRDEVLCLPDFYLEQVPIVGLNQGD